MKPADARGQETAASQTVAGMNCLTLHESPEVARIRTPDLPSEGAKRPLSRLQKRAPASLQLKSLQDSILLPSDNHNRSPIPLLSPLVTSPLRERWIEQCGLEDKEEEERDSILLPSDNSNNRESFVGNLPANGWKHPAAPFFCDKGCSFTLLHIKLF